MASRKRPASRGFVNNIILESLLGGDKYGYEIIKEVEEKSNGKIILKQPSLYSSLKRFEAKGFITSYWGDSDIGGRRHYYTITEVGRNYFNKGNKDKDFDLDDNEEDSNVEQISIDTEEDNSANVVSVTDEESSPAPTTDTESDEYNVFALLESNKTEDKSNDSPAPKVTPAENTIKQKETSIQVDMFSQNNHETDVDTEENVNLERIQQLKLSDDSTPINSTLEDSSNKKDIPLIKEQQQDFFSWEDLKRKQVVNNIEEEQQDNKPIKNQVVMDQYGILKVGDAFQEKKEQKIYDNVGTRINYNDPVIKKERKSKQTQELTEEEREIKNKKFNQKLDELISQKTNTVSTPSPTPVEEDNDIDYKNILGDLLAPENNEEDRIYQPTNYVEEDPIPDNIVEEAIEQVQTYNNYTISNKTSSFESDGFKFKPFVTEVDEVEKQTNFILSNKAKLYYGIFTFVFMILQISTLFIILKSQALLYTTDYLFYGLAYGIAVVLLLICLIPYLIIPDKRKANTFKLSYSLLFGILLFVSACALTYALNTFAGLNAANVSQFSTKLLLPIVLSINFVTTPLIYKLITMNKKMY